MFVRLRSISSLNGRYFSTTPPNFYSTLGVSKNASEKDIKAAYRKLALKWHPDRHTDTKAKDEAEKKFRGISEAYETLSNADKRKQYDIMGSAGSSYPGGSGSFQGGATHPGGFPGGFPFGGAPKTNMYYSQMSREEAERILRDAFGMEFSAHFGGSGGGQTSSSKTNASSSFSGVHGAKTFSDGKNQFVHFNFSSASPGGGGGFINPEDLFKGFSSFSSSPPSSSAFRQTPPVRPQTSKSRSETFTTAANSADAKSAQPRMQTVLKTKPGVVDFDATNVKRPNKTGSSSSSSSTAPGSSAKTASTPTPNTNLNLSRWVKPGVVDFDASNKTAGKSNTSSTTSKNEKPTSSSDKSSSTPQTDIENEKKNSQKVSMEDLFRFK